MLTNEILSGTLKGGIGALGFNVLVDSLQLNDYTIQFILSLSIILIQSLLIPLIKVVFLKIKNKVNESKKLSNVEKDLLSNALDETSNKLTDKINEEVNNLKEGGK